MDFSTAPAMMVATDWTPFLTSLLVSALCGTVIGIEREAKGKPVGIRTLVLICVGSTLFVHVSVILSGDIGDPARVAAQIVSGVGFLGAGAIMKQSEQGYVAGLTTAASIWVTAAIGMVVGMGYYGLGVISMVFVVLGMKILRTIEHSFFHNKRVEVKRIQFSRKGGKTRWRLLSMLEENMIHPREYYFNQDEEDKKKGELTLNYQSVNKGHRTFLADVARLNEVDEII